MDIFEFSAQEASERSAPLAARMRPRTFDEFAGQEHILGKGKLLRRAIESDRLFSSILLYGPPGTGKTTLARLIAAQSKARFEAVISSIFCGKHLFPAQSFLVAHTHKKHSKCVFFVSVY